MNGLAETLDEFRYLKTKEDKALGLGTQRTLSSLSI
jgi:hypothetical protein